MSEQATPAPKLTRKDFTSDQEVRWCPGCGDYSILAGMQRFLPELGIPREKIVFISGIGCSSRFPYYMNTYGMHTIHGRAPTLATGLNLTNPELQIWVVTGDGDGLSIGGNHLVHCLRRNVNLNILLFNNRIYGLTKGQYSPTSLPGHKTKSSPMGSVEQSFNPISMALGAEGTFIARTVDIFAKHMQETLKAAAEHRGTSFVEIYQNCIIFNHQAWEHVTDGENRDENVLYLEHGKPMVFGKNRDRGIRLNGLTPEVVQLGDGITEDDLLVHDAHSDDPTLAWMLSRMGPPHFPVPVGIFRSVQKPTFADLVLAQNAAAREKRGPGDLLKTFMDADTWEVKAEEPAAVPVGANGASRNGSSH
ncbi:MAG: 2-oxoacid:ferredoxin oxidoreductase subunit beta [Armatimonadota bacterium]